MFALVEVKFKKRIDFIWLGKAWIRVLKHEKEFSNILSFLVKGS
jgi:hypothetical protein